jgi:hypothetical protein
MKGAPLFVGVIAINPHEVERGSEWETFRNRVAHEH